jgi:signal transduction histidine kinase
MSHGRKVIDDLRDALQKQIDEIERASARQLDRLAERGVEELEGLRRQMTGRQVNDEVSRSDAGESERPVRDRPGHEKFEPHSARDARGERGSARAARRASRAAKRARRRAESRESRRRADGSRRGRSHRHRGHEGYRDEPPQTDPAAREHARIVARAHRRANRRIAFITHFGSYLATLAIILVATRSLRVVAIVGLGWGIGVFCHYLWAMTAPALRDRWVEEEVGELSARSVKSERRQVETRSRRSLEDLSASIAHEIRNPITAAKSLVQQMGEDPASDENLEYAETALSELDRVERSISHLLRYARDEEPRFEILELRSVASLAVDGLRDRAASSGIDLSIDFDRPSEMRGDAEKLRRVVENLISNAIDAIGSAQTASPRIEVLGGENLVGTEIWLRVIDNGSGIAPADRERIWSPFFTTRKEGTGLGLALSRKTVEAHGGRIELVTDSSSTDSRKGTEFILSFPKDPNAEIESAGATYDGR